MKGKRQEGFTLLEIIVVMAVTSILLIGIVGILQVNDNLVKKANTQIDAKTLALAIQDSVRNKLKFAQYIQIGDEKKDKIKIDGADKSAECIFIDTVTGGSSLKHQETASKMRALVDGVLTEGFEPSISFSKVSDRVIELKVAIEKDGTQQYGLKTVIEILNSPGGDQAIQVINSGTDPLTMNSIINFTKP